MNQRQDQKISIKTLIPQEERLSKGTPPGLISYQFILKRVSKQRFLPSDFGRLLELMPVFLSGISYNLRWNFICLIDLSPSRNTFGLPVMSGKFDGGPECRIE